MRSIDCIWRQLRARVPAGLGAMTMSLTTSSRPCNRLGRCTEVRAWTLRIVLRVRRGRLSWSHFLWAAVVETKDRRPARPAPVARAARVDQPLAPPERPGLRAWQGRRSMAPQDRAPAAHRARVEQA